MKIQITTHALKTAIAVAVKAINKKSAMPILESALLQQKEDGNYVLIAGDNETFITMSIDAQVDDYRPICLPVFTLSNILSTMPDQPLTFDVSHSNNVEVNYQNGKFSFMAFAPNEYPLSPTVDENNITLHFETKGDHLLQQVTMAVPFVAADELRPVMNGVYIDGATDGELTLASSDGHRLLRLTLPNMPHQHNGGVILQPKAISLLKQLVKAESICITAGNKHLFVSGEGFTLCTRLIEGNYPNYNAVIPKNNPHKIEVDRKAMINALRRVSIMSTVASRLIRLEIKSMDDKLSISAQNIDYATSAQESITMDKPAATSLAIGFKADLLRQLLETCQSDTVMMLLDTPATAMVMIDPNRPELTMLLMPMMLND